MAGEAGECEQPKESATGEVMRGDDAPLDKLAEVVAELEKKVAEQESELSKCWNQLDQLRVILEERYRP
jgi:hypothetical protein